MEFLINTKGIVLYLKLFKEGLTTDITNQVLFVILFALKTFNSTNK